jgi:hypothetical protein
VSGNNLYVANDASGDAGFIGEYDVTTGASIKTQPITGLAAPVGIAISDNALFVVETGHK